MNENLDSTQKHPRIAIVAAIGTRTRALGKDGKLIWYIPDDLKRFKALTMGHPVIMGRKTFESIIGSLGKPLPGRANIVITRDTTWSYPSPDVHVFHSFEDALAFARTLDTEEIHIGGGANLYEQVLPLIDRLYLTLIDDDQAGDTYFPPYEDEFTKKILEESREHDGLKYTWVDLER